MGLAFFFRIHTPNPGSLPEPPNSVYDFHPILAKDHKIMPYVSYQPGSPKRRSCVRHWRREDGINVPLFVRERADNWRRETIGVVVVMSLWFPSVSHHRGPFPQVFDQLK